MSEISTLLFVIPALLFVIPALLFVIPALLFVIPAKAGIHYNNPMPDKTFFVYILTNKINGTLYIGVTNDLKRRVFEHKNKTIEGFSKKYNLTLLVYYEIFHDIRLAIQREKQMKKWRRQWKINRIKEMNPEWKDLYDEL